MSVIAQGIVLRDAKLSADRRAFADDREFAALVARQSRFVFRIAYAVLRNVHDAEDAAQDVFLKIYRTNGCHNMREERAFLARAAWRAWWMHCRELRMPLVLSSTEGLRSQEIANIMGIPDGTVRTRIARARKLLKEKLAVVLEARHA